MEDNKNTNKIHFDEEDTHDLADYMTEMETDQQRMNLLQLTFNVDLTILVENAEKLVSKFVTSGGQVEACDLLYPYLKDKHRIAFMLCNCKDDKLVAEMMMSRLNITKREIKEY
jgi:hypothetical protein